ncbi:MAG: SpoIIE family protein phosphatase [Planctomycetia bacterium]|nr:SpoIIE family protein phosphatase [Planctomycetia bacterium]
MTLPTDAVGVAAALRCIADLERLLEVARRLGATVDLDELLASSVAAATDLLGCERATVFLYDAAADELRSRVATGIADSPISEIRFPASRGIAGEVARTGQLVNLPDAYADPRFNPEFDRASGFLTRSMLAVRLTDHGDATVGVLQLLNKRTGPFDARDEEIAGFLANQAGVAIQRQQLLEHFAEKQKLQRDLNIARTIQQGLLPHEQPLISGFDVAGWNQPAEETGGDFFDFLPLDDDRLAVVIADVTGHGVGPAIVMAGARAMIRGGLRGVSGLDRAVTDVHQLLCLDMPEGRFVTAFCGLLSAAAGTVEFMSAGQGPILLYDAAKGDVSELPAQGLPLAFFPEAVYENPTRVELAIGDVLVLLTDGFYEWERADGESFGQERVCELIRRHHHLPATDLIEVLFKAVVEFSAGGPQLDDLTAIIVRRTATSNAPPA